MQKNQGNPWKKIWLLSPLITLPLCIITVLWIVPSIQDYKNFVLIHPASRYRSSLVDLDARLILLNRLQTLGEYFRSGLIRSFGLAPVSPLPKIEIIVPTTTVLQLDHRLPYSAKNYFPAQLKYITGEFKDVKIRYRGDSLHHWGFAAKSWRIRTKRRDMIDGNRYFDFLLPRWSGGGAYFGPLKIAQSIGVLSYDPRFVDLLINGWQHGGIHMLKPRQNEGFLRRNNRLPGDIYEGDMIIEDAYPREQLEFSMWQLPWLWRKDAYNNKYPRDSTQPMEELVRRIGRANDDEGHLALIEMLNLEAWAKFSAWIQLVGATGVDTGHNWRLYFDPGKQKFEPIISDGMGLPMNINSITKGIPGRDLSITVPLFAKLHRNHQFLRLKYKAISQFLINGGARKLLQDLEEFEKRILPSLYSTRQLEWAGRLLQGQPIEYLGAEQMQHQLSGYRQKVSEWFEIQEELVKLNPENIQVAMLEPNVLRLQIKEHAPIAELRFGIRTFSPEKVTGDLVRYRSDGSKNIGSISSYLRRDQDQWVLMLPFLAERSIDIPKRPSTFRWHNTVATTYDLVLRNGTFSMEEPVEALDLFSNVIPVKPKAEISAIRINTINFQVVPPSPAPVIWEGNISVPAQRTISGDLIIRKGSDIILGPNASLFIYGRLLVNGTREDPVVFRAEDPGRPWGTVAVLGERASGSKLQHCHFSGGSGYTDALKLFSGMVSFRNVKPLEIADCTFSANQGYDDLLHLVYSHAKITNSTFKDAFADGIDLDISSVFFDETTFENAGNDTLDLMTSKVVILNSRLSGAKDKGISIGENSIVVIRESTIARNNIGIQVKDGSTAQIIRSNLADNTTQVSAFHKNKWYSGKVSVFLKETKLHGSGTMFDIKDDSHVYLLASSLDKEVAQRKEISVIPEGTSLPIGPAKEIMETEENLYQSLSRKLPNYWFSGLNRTDS